MLSVLIGVLSIVVMLSLAQSGHKTISRRVEQAGGMRLILWFPSGDSERLVQQRTKYDKGLTIEDVELLRDIPYLKLLSSASTYGEFPVFHTADQRVENVDVVGAAFGFTDVFSWNLESGRNLVVEDAVERRRVAILTKPLADRLFKDKEPIGQTITVLSKPYRVIGVMEKSSMFGLNFGFDWDESVFIPQVTAEVREGMPKDAKMIIAQTEDPKYNPSVVKLANGRLLAQHRGVEDFESLDFSDLLQQFYDFFKILDMVVAFIAGISLFAGGIGVMNLMLVSVSERVREIGIRKALGASRIDILTQFMIEAMTLSLVGGLIGVIAGLIITTLAHVAILQVQENWLATYSTSGIVGSFALTGAIGLLFGALPAWRASRLDIVECLRR